MLDDRFGLLVSTAVLVSQPERTMQSLSDGEIARLYAIVSVLWTTTAKYEQPGLLPRNYENFPSLYPAGIIIRSVREAFFALLPWCPVKKSGGGLFEQD